MLISSTQRDTIRELWSSLMIMQVRNILGAVTGVSGHCAKLFKNCLHPHDSSTASETFSTDDPRSSSLFNWIVALTKKKRPKRRRFLGCQLNSGAVDPTIYTYLESGLNIAGSI